MISATYSSNVYKTDEHYFESISIDMKHQGERSGFAIVLFRDIEKQCFGYDDNDVFMVTPDEWHYHDERWHELHHVARSQITRKLNEITTWAVQKFDVNDVGKMNHDCVTLRSEKGFPFNDECSFENLLRSHEMEKFERLLQNSLGRHRTYNVLKFFRKHFPELPKTLTENSEKVRPIAAKREPSYTSWGEWA